MVAVIYYYYYYIKSSSYFEEIKQLLACADFFEKSSIAALFNQLYYNGKG